MSFLESGHASLDNIKLNEILFDEYGKFKHDEMNAIYKTFKVHDYPYSIRSLGDMHIKGYSIKGHYPNLIMLSFLKVAEIKGDLKIDDGGYVKWTPGVLRADPDDVYKKGVQFLLERYPKLVSEFYSGVSGTSNNKELYQSPFEMHDLWPSMEYRSFIAHSLFTHIARTLVSVDRTLFVGDDACLSLMCKEMKPEHCAILLEHDARLVEQTNRMGGQAFKFDFNYNFNQTVFSIGLVDSLFIYHIEDITTDMIVSFADNQLSDFGMMSTYITRSETTLDERNELLSYFIEHGFYPISYENDILFDKLPLYVMDMLR